MSDYKKIILSLCVNEAYADRVDRIASLRRDYYGKINRSDTLRQLISLGIEKVERELGLDFAEPLPDNTASKGLDNGPGPGQEHGHWQGQGQEQG